MADELESTTTEQVVETQVTEPTQEQQIAEQMNFRLNGGEPPIESTETTEQVAEVVTQTEPPVFQFQTFTEKYGWQSPDDAQKEIEELRALKENPVAAEPKFENEQSKALFNAIQAGKSDEVFEILAQQKKLESLTTAEITKDNADAIVKLGMQLKYKDLTESEIEYKFKKQFGLPKEPVMGDLDDEDEFRDKHNEWKDKVAEIEMEKIIEAKLAKPDLESAKSKLVLPNIESEVDEDYLQYKFNLEESVKVATENREAYKTFNPKSIETKIDFNDETNKIAFQFQYEPDTESFAKAMEFVTNPESKNPFINQDGTTDRKKVLEALYFGLNKEKILLEAMKQAKNATLKSQLPDNSQGGIGTRTLPQSQEPNELHKWMQAAGVVK